MENQRYPLFKCVPSSTSKIICLQTQPSYLKREQALVIARIAVVN